jgi:hypothetical protein
VLEQLSANIARRVSARSFSFCIVCLCLCLCLCLWSFGSNAVTTVTLAVTARVTVTLLSLGIRCIRNVALVLALVPIVGPERACVVIEQARGDEVRYPCRHLPRLHAKARGNVFNGR